ncbi:MAG TPA: S41 family peptidase [Terriglobales bacterium]|nr:S41 family peptidase [Terriglobales bacterium]
MSKNRPFLLVLVLVGVCALLGGLYGPHIDSTEAASSALQQAAMAPVAASAGVTAAEASPDDADAAIQGDLREFAGVYRLVEDNYAAPVDPSTAIYDGAIPGMLRQLDPHSNFWDPKAFARIMENQQGRYSGVGMLISAVDARDNQARVVQPFEGTPAFKAGLRPFDLIMAVDGKSTVGLSTDQVATMLKGPQGTTVVVSVHRVGHPQLLNFSLVRADVQHDSIDSHYQISPGVVYAHLTGFTETSTEELADILKPLEAAGDMKGLVLDLRGNPGGLLNQAQGIADLLLAKDQVIVSDHGRASPEHVLTAMHGNGGHNFPLVILVDNMTASAAEIVSGSVQDHDRGLIVGQTTFGKGLVQTVMPLDDNTGLALTTAHYYTPSGRLIQRPYEGVSLYDYFFVHNENQTPVSKREVKMTDTGRTVYGGGGITPDVNLPADRLNDFQQMMVDRTAFFEFADEFLSTHDSVPQTWTPDDATVQQFVSFLASQHVPLKPADVAANSDWLKQQIRFRVISSLYGLDAGWKTLMQVDPEVAKAVTLLPQAATLETHARQVLLARQEAH